MARHPRVWWSRRYFGGHSRPVRRRPSERRGFTNLSDVPGASGISYLAIALGPSGLPMAKRRLRLSSRRHTRWHSHNAFRTSVLTCRCGSDMKLSERFPFPRWRLVESWMIWDLLCAALAASKWRQSRLALCPRTRGPQSAQHPRSQLWLMRSSNYRRLSPAAALIIQATSRVLDRSASRPGHRLCLVLWSQTSGILR